MTYTWTWADMDAYYLMKRAEGWGSCTLDTRRPTDAGNEIIALASRIQAERSAAAMQIMEDNHVAPWR